MCVFSPPPGPPTPRRFCGAEDAFKGKGDWGAVPLRTEVSARGAHLGQRAGDARRSWVRGAGAWPQIPRGRGPKSRGGGVAWRRPLKPRRLGCP